MPGDNLVSVCYRVLRYVEACRKKGLSPTEDQALSLSEADPEFFAQIAGML